MMADFSFGQAIGAGFKILGRRPLTVLIWAVAYLVLVAAPSFGLMAWVMPQMIASFRDAAQHAVHGVAPVPADAVAMRSNLFALQPLLWLAQVAAHAILMAAVFRAVLTPDDSKWGYLRLGREELWLGLTNLVLTVMAAIMILTLFIPLGIGLGVGMASAQHGQVPGPASLPLLWLIAAVGVAAIAWVLVRLCLAPAMAFATRRFVLYESWQLTRGHALKIFGVILVLVVLVWLFELVTLGFGGAFMARGLMGGAGWQAAMKGSPSDILQHMAPMLTGVVVLVSVIGMIIYTLIMAPLASIYQQLTRG
jgi:hypothetical protein